MAGPLNFGDGLQIRSRPPGPVPLTAESRFMTDPAGLSEDESTDSTPPPLPEEPLKAYRDALARYDEVRLRPIQERLELVDVRRTPGALVEAIADALGSTRAADRVLGGLDVGPRLTLGIAALTEVTSWPAVGLRHALACAGVEPGPAILALLESGLAAVRVGEPAETVLDFGRAISGADADRATIQIHPAAPAAARTVLPPGPGPVEAGEVREIREADGLEPILRIAAAWQRVAESPLRQTQTGTLYKRDRERIADDPALAGPIADALEPLPDPAQFWYDLALGTAAIIPEPGTDRLVAAPPGYWDDNAVHLPQMVAARWLGLRRWHELGGQRTDDAAFELALPYVRPAVLLWLATLPEGGWVALDDLAAHLDAVAPGWDAPWLDGGLPSPSTAEGRDVDAGPLGSILLGPAYQLGLVRAARDVPGHRRVVQLSPLGRYALALGPPPPARAVFDHFLFVQPNFEMIAYRQGLTPALIGQLGRFAEWSRVGAALELKLTPGSVYRGLEGGLTYEDMMIRLGKHSQRALPAGVAESIRSWSDRRERVTYYAAATLIEFASAEDLETALTSWPTTTRVAPVRAGERLLLVEDETTIPFGRLRLAGSRDYRRPPEACIEVEPDGVTLALDLGRSDLLVDAELARFADEMPADASAGDPRRRFVVTRESLSRGAEDDLSEPALGRWFAKRTGTDIPAAIRLLLHAGSGRSQPLTTSRPIILRSPTAELLDGLLQHPATRHLLGERLGPTAIILDDRSLDLLRPALLDLGLPALDSPPPAPSKPDPPPAPIAQPKAASPATRSGKTRPSKRPG